MTMTGGCVCGALRYRAEGEPLLQGICHCRNCQRMGGGGHAGFICFAKDAVTVEGPSRTHGMIGGSGMTATRHACPVCMSLVFGTAEVMPGRVKLYAGSLDDTARFAPQIAIFTRSRPPWDTSSIGLKCFETLPTG